MVLPEPSGADTQVTEDFRTDQEASRAWVFVRLQEPLVVKSPQRMDEPSDCQTVLLFRSGFLLSPLAKRPLLQRLSNNPMV